MLVIYIQMIIYEAGQGQLCQVLAIPANKACSSLELQSKLNLILRKFKTTLKFHIEELICKIALQIYDFLISL